MADIKQTSNEHIVFLCCSSSQQPLVPMDSNPAYNPVISLATEELPPSHVPQTDIYEAVGQSSEPVNIAPNPSYQQHTFSEYEYSYPEVNLTPDQDVHLDSTW